jgi:pimeloyl-ACP methyl ester carboxylesterase
VSGRGGWPGSLLRRLGLGGRGRPPEPALASRDAPFAIARYDTCLADLEPEALRALIAELNAQSETVGCAVFRPPGDHDCVATIFAGNLERYFMVAAARQLRCPVVYIQDPVSFWYQGSPLLPDLDALCRRVVIPETGTARALLFGQSSGAYAALAAAARMPGATVVACAPQTFSDAGAKGRITFVGVRALSAPEGLIDLRAHLAAHPDPEAMRAVLIAAGELDNPAHLHWWGDYLHMLRLSDVPDTDCFVVNANTHVLAHGRVNEYARLLRDLAAEAASPPARRAEILRAFLAELYTPVPG